VTVPPSPDTEVEKTAQWFRLLPFKWKLVVLLISFAAGGGGAGVGAYTGCTRDGSLNEIKERATELRAFVIELQRQRAEDRELVLATRSAADTLAQTAGSIMTILTEHRQEAKVRDTGIRENEKLLQELRLRMDHTTEVIQDLKRRRPR